MKLLIAYDGSESSDAAIVDLPRAGLPDATEALVLCVAEACADLSDISYAAVEAGLGGYPPNDLDPATYVVPDVKALAARAVERLSADFPTWKIGTETWVDSPEVAIVRKAHAWQPDLIVVGSHGHSTLGRLVLGSVSQHVLHHTDCSIRISRHHLHSQKRPIRLLIGVDGSDPSKSAVQSVAARNWPADTEISVLGVMDSHLALAATEMVEGLSRAIIVEESRMHLSKAVHQAVEELVKHGLHASPQILSGNPAHVLVQEAERWGADCIFVGAKRHGGIEGVLLGSVSNAVAAQSHCSVEIVRPLAT